MEIIKRIKPNKYFLNDFKHQFSKRLKNNAYSKSANKNKKPRGKTKNCIG